MWVFPFLSFLHEILDFLTCLSVPQQRQLQKMLDYIGIICSLEYMEISHLQSFLLELRETWQSASSHRSRKETLRDTSYLMKLYSYFLFQMFLPSSHMVVRSRLREAESASLVVVAMEVMASGFSMRGESVSPILQILMGLNR